MWKRIIFIIYTSLVVLFHIMLFGQGKQQIIQFSGIVIDEDTLGVPGAHILIKGFNTGTISDPLGYFALPTKQGDTIIFRSVGHKTHEVIISNRDDYGFFMVVNLDADTTILPAVEIFPFPTRERFKQAFLSLQLEQPNLGLQNRINGQTIARLANVLPASASENYRRFIQNQNYRSSASTFVPTLSLTNPFAWAKFIQSLKTKKKREKKQKRRLILPNQ